MSIKKRVGRLIMLVLIVFSFVAINMGINKARHEREGDYPTSTEFVRTIDCAPYFDEEPNARYKISFGAKGSQEGYLLVYQQNDVNSRYYFEESIYVTTEYKQYELVIKPQLVDKNEEQSYLSFYGEYGSGLYPSIKNITIQKYEE